MKRVKGKYISSTPIWYVPRLLALLSLLHSTRLKDGVRSSWQRPTMPRYKSWIGNRHTQASFQWVTYSPRLSKRQERDVSEAFLASSSLYFLGSSIRRVIPPVWPVWPFSTRFPSWGNLLGVLEEILMKYGLTMPIKASWRICSILPPH